MSNLISSTSVYPVSNSAIKRDDINKNLEKSRQVVTDNVESNSISKMFMGDSDPNEVIMLLLPLMVLDNVVDKLMCVNGDKSLLNKAANFGDKISDTFHLGKIISGDKRKKISKFINNNEFTKYFTDTYQAVPKFAKHSKFSSQFKSELTSALAKISDNEEFLNILKENSGKLSDTTKKVFTKIVESQGAVNLSSDELIKTVEDMTKLGIDKYNAGSFFNKKICFGELAKKLQAADSKLGKTSLGKFVSKGMLKTKDALTYSGGLISMIFVATGLLNSYKEAKEAPKGEKLSTFMHVLSEQYLGFILFAPSTNIMYKLGGNKYRGMTKEAKKALNDLVQTSNKTSLTREACKVANIQKNLLIKGVDKDKVAELTGKGIKEVKTMAKNLKKEGAKLKFWEKPLKFIGKMLSAGLDDIRRHKTIKIPKLGEKMLPHPTLKGFAGGLGRLLLILLVIQPIIQKPLTKLCHKIFGKPETYLKKQEQQEKAQTSDNKNPQSNVESTNLIDRYTPQKSNDNSMNPAQPHSQANQPAAQTPIDSVPLKPGKANANTPISPETSAIHARKISDNDSYSGYIPSIEPVKLDNNDKELEKQADEIIKSTDTIIKNAKAYL